MRKSISEDMALAKPSVALTDGGASGEAPGIFDEEPMCMATTVPVSAQAFEERVPVARCGWWAGRDGREAR